MALTDLLRGSTATFASQVTGPISYDPFSDTGPPSTQGGGPSHWFMREIVKPALYLQPPIGQPFVFEPYGKPTRDYSAFFSLGVLAVAVGGVYALYRVGQIVERRNRGR